MTENLVSASPPPVVHVAVGTSPEKTAALLRWTFTNFDNQHLSLLHVHRPSSRIPTLLGRLPASQASPEMVAAFRKEEREETVKLLSEYLMICTRSKVKASILMSEANEAQKEIVNLVNLHNIRKLVVGAIPDCIKGKKTSRKASHAAKHAPSFCEIWFVDKGKLIWTRQASGIVPLHCQTVSSFRSLNTDSGYFTSSEKRSSSFSSLKSVEQLNIQLAEVKEEADESNNEAYMQLLEYKEFGTKALETFNEVKTMEMAHLRELILREDAEYALQVTMQEQEKILEEIEKMKHQLQRTMLNIAFLDSRTQEANCRREEVAGELELIQSSIASLREEKRKLQLEKIGSQKWLDTKIPDQYENGNEIKCMESVGNLSKLQVFLLTDLETATCNFSESFKIGKGEFGIVYKGELLNRTVAIKRLHFFNIQRQIELHKAVEVFGKPHHPHVVEVIGVCPESWIFVYEYLPGGSLQNYLCSKNNIGTLNWKTRAQMVSDIASGLSFLHSAGHNSDVHGNLKPENVLLDLKQRCKISDYADCMLTGSQALRCPSFRHSSAASRDFSYTDPEYHRTGLITQKSDIFSFGLIILQLVTGKTLGGLIAQVCRAVSNGEVTSVLDLSAGEWSTYVARRLVELGLQCCESNSRDRPELTPSLIKELEHLPFLEDQTVPSLFLCPILHEIMHDPQVAADGFTYEGDALRGWLRKGHETSPMTNVKLSHLDLIPNVALKLAIQDWICRS